MDDPRKRQVMDPDQAVTLTLDQLNALIMNAVSAAQGSRSTAGELASAITQGMQAIKEPIPENKIPPQISSYNPFGDRDCPRPGLRCETWLGVIQQNKDGSRHVTAAGEIPDETLTCYEQLALNILPAWDGAIEGMDGSQIKVKVTLRVNDTTGQPERMVIGLEQRLLGKKADVTGRNMVPPLCELVRQITGIDMSRRALSDDDAKWLMARHRVGQYYTSRGGEVAA